MSDLQLVTNECNFERKLVSFLSVIGGELIESLDNLKVWGVSMKFSSKFEFLKKKSFVQKIENFKLFAEKFRT